MTEQPHREVDVLNAALELPPDQRTAYLDQACVGDAVLFKQVEALLRAHEQAESFLDVPPAALDFQRTAKVNIPLTEKPGDRIGRYNLLQQIGEGVNFPTPTNRVFCPFLTKTSHVLTKPTQAARECGSGDGSVQQHCKEN